MKIPKYSFGSKSASKNISNLKYIKIDQFPSKFCSAYLKVIVKLVENKKETNKIRKEDMESISLNSSFY